MLNFTLQKLLSSSISFTVVCCIFWRSLSKSSLKLLVTMWIFKANLLYNVLLSDYMDYITRLSLVLSTLFCKTLKIYHFKVLLFFDEHSRFTGPQGKGETISVTPFGHSAPPHRHLDISRAIAADILYIILFYCLSTAMLANLYLISCWQLAIIYSFI